MLARNLLSAGFHRTVCVIEAGTVHITQTAIAWVYLCLCVWKIMIRRNSETLAIATFAGDVWCGRFHRCRESGK